MTDESGAETTKSEAPISSKLDTLRSFAQTHLGWSRRESISFLSASPEYPSKAARFLNLNAANRPVFFSSRRRADLMNSSSSLSVRTPLCPTVESKNETSFAPSGTPMARLSSYFLLTLASKTMSENTGPISMDSAIEFRLVLSH